jgi:uncharacterized protein
MITRNKVFLDTSFTIALSFITDRNHEHARVLTAKIKQTNTSLITTRAVIIEILNTLAKERYRKGAINLINSLEADPDITIVPITEDLYNKALKLYKTRVDKEWGITDCISFVVMEEYGLTEALTADKHFQQAGFKALLLL